MAFARPVLSPLFALCWCLLVQIAAAQEPPAAPPAANAETAAVTTESSAEPAASAVDAEIARGLFEAGLLRASRGEWPEALELFARSRAMVDRPTTALNHALVLVRSARFREALVVLSEAEALCSDADADVLARVNKLRTDVAPLVGVLELSIVPPAERVKVDGEASALSAGQARMVLDPGPHRIEVSVAGHEALSTDINLSKGETRKLELKLTALPQATAPVVELQKLAGKPSHDDRQRPAMSRRKKIWIASVLGAVAVGVGVGVGVAVARNNDDGASGPDGGSAGVIFSPN